MTGKSCFPLQIAIATRFSAVERDQRHPTARKGNKKERTGYMKKPNMKGMGFPILVGALLIAMLLYGISNGNIIIHDTEGNPITFTEEDSENE